MFVQRDVDAGQGSPSASNGIKDRFRQHWRQRAIKDFVYGGLGLIEAILKHCPYGQCAEWHAGSSIPDPVAEHFGHFEAASADVTN